MHVMKRLEQAGFSTECSQKAAARMLPDGYPDTSITLLESSINAMRNGINKGMSEATRTPQSAWGNATSEGHLLLARMGLNGVVHGQDQRDPTKSAQPFGCWAEAEEEGHLILKLPTNDVNAADVTLVFTGLHFDWIHPTTRVMKKELPWGNCLFDSIAAAAVLSRALEARSQVAAGWIRDWDTDAVQ